MSQSPASVVEFVESAFAHRESRKVPLWGIIHNRPVYEHVLGPQRAANSAEVSTDDKLQLHAEVYRQLGIHLTRAQLWPPDRNSTKKGGTDWPEHDLTADRIALYKPKFPDDEARDQDVALRCRQIEINRPHTVFAPTIRGIFCPTFEKMGLEQFSYACADSPQEIERIMEAHTQYARSLAERYAIRKEVRFMAICDDMAFKTGTLFPPDWMRQRWIPRLARIIAPLKKKRLRVIFHSDGRMDELIPDLIGIGFDAINPLEPLAGMDLTDLKKRFGKDVTLIGGVDCSQLLSFGTPQQVRDEVKRLLDIGAPGGGFVIGDSSSVLPDTPVKNVLAFYETVHEYSV